jgi:hypothetical protein
MYLSVVVGRRKPSQRTLNHDVPTPGTGLSLKAKEYEKLFEAGGKPVRVKTGLPPNGPAQRGPPSVPRWCNRRR